jgi:transposase InsO family protein
LGREGYPIRKGCALLNLPRSSYYYPPVQAEESAVGVAIEEIAGQYPTYGTRRVTHQLRRPPHEMRVNRKRVRRIMTQKGLLRPVKRTKKRTTDSEHPYPRYPNLVKELVTTCPDQVWVSDITYIRYEKRAVNYAAMVTIAAIYLWL